MQKIYLVCENVDLGYHVIEAYLNEERANEVVSALNKKYEEDKRKKLMSNPYIHYSLEADNPEYYVDTCELKDLN